MAREYIASSRQEVNYVHSADAVTVLYEDIVQREDVLWIVVPYGIEYGDFLLILQFLRNCNRHLSQLMYVSRDIILVIRKSPRCRWRVLYQI